MRTLHNSTRRSFLAAVGVAMGASWARWRPGGLRAHLRRDVHIVDFDATGKRKDVMEVPKIVKTDAEWRKQLDPEQFDVTRKAGTEPPFTGKYWNQHEDGIFACVCCGTPLFDSKTKFESGTGWPSFYQRSSREKRHGKGRSQLSVPFAPKWNALTAMRTWATFSMTVRGLPVCGIA